MIPHRPSHWIAVAVVIAMALIAAEVQGQGSGASAVFEGRPAMAGAQAGLGAQAGPPQGGVGVQGSEAAQRLLRPRTVREQPAVATARCEPASGAARDDGACVPQVRDERLERRLTILGVDAQQRGRM